MSGKHNESENVQRSWVKITSPEIREMYETNERKSM